MPISARGRFDTRFGARFSAGFSNRGVTLVEVLVVLAIIAVGAALASLSMGSTGQTQLREDARTLGRFFNRVAVEAAATGATFLVKEHGRQFEARAQAGDGMVLPSLTLDARVVSLMIDGQPAPTGSAIDFPPTRGRPFELMLEFRNSRFIVARDGLGRIAVRAMP